MLGFFYHNPISILRFFFKNLPPCSFRCFGTRIHAGSNTLVNSHIAPVLPLIIGCRLLSPDSGRPGPQRQHPGGQADVSHPCHLFVFRTQTIVWRDDLCCFPKTWWFKQSFFQNATCKYFINIIASQALFSSVWSALEIPFFSRNQRAEFSRAGKKARHTPWKLVKLLLG